MNSNYKQFREETLKGFEKVTSHFDSFCECAEGATKPFRVDVPNGHWVFYPHTKIKLKS